MCINFHYLRLLRNEMLQHHFSNFTLVFPSYNVTYTLHLHVCHLLNYVIKS